MISFFNRTPTLDLDCYTVEGSVYRTTPIVPAMKAKPEWVDKIQKSNSRIKIDDNDNIVLNNLKTIRTCYGFLELYKRGFILESWCDFAFNVVGEKLSCINSNFTTPKTHPPVQISPGFTGYHMVKLQSAWIARCKEDTPFVLFGAEWSMEKMDVKVIPGVLNFRDQHNMNLFLAMKKTKEPQYLEIPMGQALAHFVPLTEKKLKIRNHIIDEAELKKLQVNPHWSVYGWRRMFSLQKRNITRGTCPFTSD